MKGCFFVREVQFTGDVSFQNQKMLAICSIFWDTQFRWNGLFYFRTVPVYVKFHKLSQIKTNFCRSLKLHLLFIPLIPCTSKIMISLPKLYIYILFLPFLYIRSFVQCKHVFWNILWGFIITSLFSYSTNRKIISVLHF